MRQFVHALLVTSWIGLGLEGQVAAQEASEKEPGVRMLYSGRNLSVQDLAIFLSKSYEGQAGIKFVAGPSANVLAIRTSTQGQMDEVLKTLEVADRPKQQIAFQALLLDFAGAEGAPVPVIDTNLLTGSADEVLKNARDWVREGKVARARAYNLTALDNQIANTSTTEIVPRPVSPTAGQLGAGAQKTEQKLGVTFSVIPRVTDTNDILCEMIFDSTELKDKAPAQSGPGTERTQVVQERTQTTIRIPNGGSTIVSGRDGDVRSPHPSGLLVVSARIVEPKAAKTTQSK